MIKMITVVVMVMVEMAVMMTTVGRDVSYGNGNGWWWRR